MIRISEQDFDIGDEITKLEQNNIEDGALVIFTGKVRANNDGHNVTGLFLEHYPAMTEKLLADIVKQAQSKWHINLTSVIHRIGQLYLGDNIVFIGVTSKHRKDAFAAAEFIIDHLKTQAPFWKKETRKDGKFWVDAKISDQQKALNW